MMHNHDFSITKYNLSYVYHASEIPLQHKTIAKSFAELAIKYPNYECYIFKGENKKYTYKSFQYETDCLAKSLHELGFRKGDCLGAILPNCSQTVVLTYAASQLGLIKVHIDPACTLRELTYKIRRTQCKGVVTMANVEIVNKLKKELSGLRQEPLTGNSTLEHMILTDFSDEINIDKLQGIYSYNDLIHRTDSDGINCELDDSSFTKETVVDPDCPLSILFTSGSTGQPKPVVLTNFSIFNSTNLLTQHFGVFCTRYCAPLSLVHISSGIRGVLLPSVTKCTVIIPAVAYDPEIIMSTINEERITCMMSGPGLLYGFLANPKRHQYDLSSLKYITLSGANVSSELLRKIELELGINRAGQVYGMSESASLLTSTLYAELDDDRRYTSIGKCLPHMELKVADENGLTVPVDTEGEIWARGYGVMAEYYRDPERTNETITKNGWLKTGDIGKMDPDGFFYFVGRKSDIIVRYIGNVYPMEIELAIGMHAGVHEVHVFSIPDNFTDSVICACIQLKPNMVCDANELKLFLKDKLTSYKIPEHFRFVESFPRALLGKVDKLKLADAIIQGISEGKNDSNLY